MLSPKARASGFTLVELMVALVAGLILLGSVLTLVAANMQNNSLTVRDMRVSQESRALATIIANELRRNGYVGDSMRMIGSGTSSSDFPEAVALTDSCISYAYDANANGVLDAGERRLFSRGVVDGHGAVFRKVTTTAAATFASTDCGTGTQISSDDIDVACLGFADSNDGDLAAGSDVACYDAASGTSPAIDHPDGGVYVAMRVALVDSPETKRRSEMQVSVRSPVYPVVP